MRTARTLAVGLAALLCVAPSLAAGRANEMTRYIGRTGLPAVIDGKDNVWMESGQVRLNVKGTDLVADQTFRLHYPSPPLETGKDRSQVAVREEFYRAKGEAGPVTTDEAKGFSQFTVYVDGKQIDTTATPWKVNDEQDTATRYRTFWLRFTPGEVHTMRIVSVAPLGWAHERRVVNFMDKDLGGWRGNPNLLDIRFTAPGRAEARLAGLEPKPDNVNSNGVRWVFRKAHPDRDIYIELPLNYPGGRASR